jgi:hypothetical protein
MNYLGLSSSEESNLIQIACSGESEVLTTGLKATFRVARAFQLTGVKASLTTAQATGGLLTVDITLGGSTIFGTQLTFNNASTTTVGATTPPTYVIREFPVDSQVEISVASLGDGTATGLKVTFLGRYI